MTRIKGVGVHLWLAFLVHAVVSVGPVCGYNSRWMALRSSWVVPYKQARY
jgi:hypothetical protein